MEKQFEADFRQPHSTMAVEGEDPDQDEAPLADLDDSDTDVDLPDPKSSETMEKLPVGVKHALRRLHENTGHRSGKRLARALAIAGAPANVVKGALRLRCSICDEHRAPKARRPTSLPTPKDVGDQVHIDIFEVFDLQETRFYIVRAIDFVSRLQMAELVDHKSSDRVARFMSTRWLPVLGAPRTLVADQGREFVSHEFEEFCSGHSIYLHHTPVQAPWQNGIVERGGSVLKGIIRALVKSHSVYGRDDVDICVQEAVAAYNGDMMDSGVTPSQAAFGRQPRLHGDTLGDFGRRLSEHSLIDSKPKLSPSGGNSRDSSTGYAAHALLERFEESCIGPFKTLHHRSQSATRSNSLLLSSDPLQQQDSWLQKEIESTPMAWTCAVDRHGRPHQCLRELPWSVDEVCFGTRETCQFS